jgi:hypothetical protein
VKRLVIALVLFAGCKDSDDQEPVNGQAMVVRPPQDTTRFTVPASARRCHDGRSLLIEAASRGGSGILLRVKYEDSLTSGTYPVLWPDDTASRRGATVAVRYVVREVASSFVLDSGTVDVQHSGNTLGAHVVGRGVENAIRMFATADLRAVPLRADTVSCRYQP